MFNALVTSHQKNEGEDVIFSLEEAISDTEILKGAISSFFLKEPLCASTIMTVCRSTCYHVAICFISCSETG